MKIESWQSAFWMTLYDTYSVSVRLIEKWRHFVSPKTLLRFRVRFRVRVRVSAEVSVIRFRSNVFSIKGSRSVINTIDDQMLIRPVLIFLPEWAYSDLTGRVHCFSMQVVINKCFFLNPEKILVHIRLVVFEKNATLIPKSDVTEPKARW